MDTRKISTIIIACLLFNNLSFAGAVEVPGADISVPAVQTSVYQLMSLVRLPFTITAKIFREDAPLFPGYAKPAPGRDRGGAAGKKDTKAGKDCSFFFSNTEKDMRFDLKTDNISGAAIDVSKDLVRGSGTLWLNLIFYWLGFKYIFLLACLMSLSKSNLPWEISYSCA